MGIGLFLLRNRPKRRLRLISLYFLHLPFVAHASPVRFHLTGLPVSFPLRFLQEDFSKLRSLKNLLLYLINSYTDDYKRRRFCSFRYAVNNRLPLPDSGTKKALQLQGLPDEP